MKTQYELAFTTPPFCQKIIEALKFVLSVYIQLVIFTHYGYMFKKSNLLTNENAITMYPD